MFQNWDKWMTKKYPKVGFGSKWKTNVKNVRALQYTGVHVHVCGISRRSQYAAREEKKQTKLYISPLTCITVERQYTELLYNKLVGIT